MEARGRPLLLLTLGLVLGCDRERAPPPLPIAPPPLPSAPSAFASDEGSPTHARVHEPKPKSAAQRKAAERSAAPSASTPPPKRERPVTAKVVGPAPARGPSPFPVEPVAPAQLTIPRTPHVRPEIPSGLESDLAADPRMQPWLERVVAIADDCHARDRDARGTLQALVTMHADARPDADLKAVPPSLMRVVACATGALFRLKMPLFTGREGVRYTVRLHFE